MSSRTKFSYEFRSYRTINSWIELRIRPRMRAPSLTVLCWDPNLTILIFWSIISYFNLWRLLKEGIEPSFNRPPIKQELGNDIHITSKACSRRWELGHSRRVSVSVDRTWVSIMTVFVILACLELKIVRSSAQTVTSTQLSSRERYDSSRVYPQSK